MRFWTLLGGAPGNAARNAERAEAAGWHGLGLTDSQNIAGDVWVALTSAALASDRLHLGTCVTNPITRHPAVTAAAALGLAGLAGDRLHVGIGRGDSALAHLGRAPASPAQLESYAITVGKYLRGDPVDFAAIAPETATPEVERLGLADAPQTSTIEWRNTASPVIPVEVTASGPKVIGAAARSADRVIFALGADHDRLTWGIETARAARRDAGLDPDTLRFGAYLNLACHPDLDVARTLVAGSLATTARFSIMHGSVNGPVNDRDRAVLEKLHASYDMRRHMQTGSATTQALTTEFIDRTAIVGPARHCIERLRAIEALGIDRAVVIGPSPGSDPDDAAAATRHVTAEVLPAFS